MKAFIAAIAAIAVISVGMYLGLNNAGFSAADTASDSNVRLGD